MSDDGPLLRELKWVHSHIRRDLATVSELSRRVTEGEDADAIRDGIAELQTNGPLWQLRFNCLNYCRFVHSHHNLEDAALFPALRDRDQALGPVIDRLEADHRVVSDLLDEVEAQARGSLEHEDEVRRAARVGAGSPCGPPAGAPRLRGEGDRARAERNGGMAGPMMLRAGEALFLFALGAAGGLLGDAGNVQSGATRYLDDSVPFIWESPLWFAVLVGFAAVSIAEIRLRLGPTRPGSDPRIGVAAFAAVIGIYALTSIVGDDSLPSATLVDRARGIVVCPDRGPAGCGVRSAGLRHRPPHGGGDRDPRALGVHRRQ